MKAYLRITGALLMGAILIVGALLLPKDQSVDADENAIIVTEAPSREYIEVDENKNGKPDWEEMLTARIVDSIQVPPREVAPPIPYEAPTTFTGKFAESFIADYLGNKSGNEPLANPEVLVESALSSIKEGSRSKEYTKSDITVIPDSQEAIREYGNKLGAIMSSKPSTGDFDIAIANDALKSKDPAQLERLENAKQNYLAMVRETLEVPVPTSYVPLHLDLINAYEAVYTDIVAMQQIFSDPLYALSRFKQHYTDQKRMFVAIEGIQRKMTIDRIAYAPEDPGAYLFIFKL